MTSSERPSPEPILKKEASPAVLRGREFSGNALEASSDLNYWVWGVPSRAVQGKSGKSSGSVSRVFFPEFPPETPSRIGGMAYYYQRFS